MPKFRKKPVVIEAMRFNGSQLSGQQIKEWAGPEADIAHMVSSDDVANVLVIPTLEGHMYANAGDYIIKGVNGEFYPCKPDIFAQTYEAIE